MSQVFLPVPSHCEMREIRCPKCRRLLLKVRGIAEIEIVCHRCGSLVIWPQLNLAVIATDAQTGRVLSEERFSTGGMERVGENPS